MKKSEITVDPNRLAFLQGMLAAFASNGQTVHYNEVRRLCRLNQEQLGTYLGAARQKMLAEGQPDFCSIVVRDSGWPGDGWADGLQGTDPREWARALRQAQIYWSDRRRLDNPKFEEKHSVLPEVPGL